MLCTDCPRACRIDRSKSSGCCHAGPVARVARTMLHMWEEPAISGTRGSGAIFFSGCNLGCVYCQNYSLSDGALGQIVNSNELYEMMLSLQAQGAHNINLVTATPHLPTLIPALKRARTQGLKIPVVYNTSGYETLDTLHRLDGLIDIYLPDVKYVSSQLSEWFSHAKDYFAYAMPAVQEMQRQVGSLQLGDDGLAKRGMIVRHLILPNCTDDSRSVLDALANGLPIATWLSLMRQYTPTPLTTEPPLNRRITDREYDRTISYALSLGFHNIWIQEKSSANSFFTPAFTDYQ